MVLAEPHPERTLLVTEEVQGVVLLVKPDKSPCTLQQGNSLFDPEHSDALDDCHRVHGSLFADLFFQITPRRHRERTVMAADDVIVFVRMGVDGVDDTLRSSTVMAHENRTVIELQSFDELLAVEQVERVRSDLGDFDFFVDMTNSSKAGAVRTTKEIVQKEAFDSGFVLVFKEACNSDMAADGEFLSNQ